MASIGFKEDSEGFWIEKDANANKDYTIDYTKWLVGDTLASVVWTIPSDVNKENEGITPDGLKAFVKLSGGITGKTYIISAHIVTALGREDDTSFRLVIREQ